MRTPAQPQLKPASTKRYARCRACGMMWCMCTGRVVCGCGSRDIDFNALVVDSVADLKQRLRSGEVGDHV